MAIFSVEGICIEGLAASVPSTIVSNLECELFDEKERKQFVKKTGIEKRRIADSGICASDLCAAATVALLDHLSWTPEELDVLIFVSQTPDYITPATAVILQNQLGLKKSCIAFDINLGCSGYVYGLSVIASLLRHIPHGRGLLLVGDVSSACISPLDKSTVPLFSDAGSATAVRQIGESSMTFNLESDGSGFDAIIIPHGGYRHPVTTDSLIMREIDKGIIRNDVHLILKGIDIFNFSVTEVPSNISRLMNHCSITAHDVDYLVLHQANKIINEAIREALAFPEEKTPLSLLDYGNTSSASIPLTMITQLREKMQTEKLKWILSGFGVGLSWGSVYLQTENICCPPLVVV